MTGAHGSDSTDPADAGVHAVRRDDATVQLPVYSGSDRIDESFRTAFVAAGLAKPGAGYPGPNPLVDPARQPGTGVEASGDPAEAAGDESERGLRRRSRRRRLDRVVAAAAAVAAVLAAGSAGSVTAASTARPGDTLWPISRVIYADRARSIEASEDAHTALAQAREAAARGDTETTRRHLQRAREKLHEVRRGTDEAHQVMKDFRSTTAMADAVVPTDDTAETPSVDDSSTSGPSEQARRHDRGPGASRSTGPDGSRSNQPSQGPVTPTPMPPPPGQEPSTQPPTEQPEGKLSASSAASPTPSAPVLSDEATVDGLSAVE